MDAITRQHVGHGAVETDAAKIARLEAVAAEWQRLVRGQAHRLRAPASIALAARPRAVVKAFRASPDRARSASLNSHLQQEAVTHARAIVAGGWEQAAERVRSRIAKRLAARRITDAEAHGLRWLLRWPSHLAALVEGRVVAPDDDASAADGHAALDRWLRGALLRARPARPRLRHALWLNADAMTCRASLRPGEAFSSRTTLPALERGRPARIPLAGDGISHLAEGKTLRVSAGPDTRGHGPVVLRYALETRVTPRGGGQQPAQEGLRPGDRALHAPRGREAGPAASGCRSGGSPRSHDRGPRGRPGDDHDQVRRRESVVGSRLTDIREPTMASGAKPPPDALPRHAGLEADGGVRGLAAEGLDRAR